MIQREEPLYYADYLQLGKILDAQDLESTKKGKTAHDEMLFIVVHQAYELWFKQILWELDGVREVLGHKTVQERALGKAVAHLERVSEIQRVLLQQIDVLETMTPLDFLDFRDTLVPASGFQSAQWRLIENRMGLRTTDRHGSNVTAYTSRFSEEDRERVSATEEDQSLFQLVERWLERTPFIRFGMYDFWQSYRESVARMLDSDANLIAGNPTLTDQEKEAQQKGLQKTREHFDALFDARRYAQLQAEGECRLNHTALQAALLINLYRDEPILHLPFRLIQALVDIDENFTTWRYRHALMVRRMIGTKIGTGGSSGHEYLRMAAERNRVFTDFVNLSTFFIPRSDLPELPQELVSQMGFRWHPDGEGRD